MNKTYELLEYTKIVNLLSEKAVSQEAKALCLSLEPCYKELTLRKELRDTTQARAMIHTFGNPPLPLMEHISEYVARAVSGELLSAEEIGRVGNFLVSIERMKQYLEKGCSYQLGLAYYHENLSSLAELKDEINRCIRNDKVDDYASSSLHDIRKKLLLLDEKIRSKADSVMKSSKAALAENFVVTRNGRICIPVKKDCRSKVPGTVIDTSKGGSTLFIEPSSVTKLQDEYDLLKIEEDNEERRILYSLICLISDNEIAFTENIKTLISLDFIFAKGKLSLDMNAIEPTINTNHHIRILHGRHPSLAQETCVPLDFEIGNVDSQTGVTQTGMIITGPNTGGKTVTIKTVGLFCLMACSGLHIPCAQADICMNNQVLCDIGDGQNISDNLSTFSSHIKTEIDILKKVTKESFVIIDELGSGTDPAEGMGIAISIIEQLKRSGCLFLITTHYPEVKSYAEKQSEIMNARMGFDRDNLKPIYKLEPGKSGESCALYIAKRLGLPEDMIEYARCKAYGEAADHIWPQDGFTRTIKKETSVHIEKISSSSAPKMHIPIYSRGDSVTISPDNRIGIVVTPDDENGMVCVQVKKEKFYVNQKRLQLKVAATELYPPDYDFSIIFDTVENRKARHQLNKGHYNGTVPVFEK